MRYEIHSFSEPCYETRLVNNTNPTLLSNFKKVANWIKENCPNLNGEFHTSHNAFYKLDLIVENGIAYLCSGSHSCGYATTLSEFGTDFYSQGSCQSIPYRFEGHYGFSNDYLEKFLKEWPSIKERIIEESCCASCILSSNNLSIKSSRT